MTEQNNQPPGQPAEAPKLRPHVTIVRQIVYQGDAALMQTQINERSLPDGLYVVQSLQGVPVGTITIKTAEPEIVQPEFLHHAKHDLIARETEAREKREAEARRPVLVNPHTGQPMRRN